MGQKYGTLNAQGILIFYDSADSPVPEGVEAIELTDEQWKMCLATPGCTISSGQVVPPSQVDLLKLAAVSQKVAIDNGYSKALSQDISFTTQAGVTKAYAADSASVSAIHQAAQAYTVQGFTPLGYYWKASDGTLVPFTLHDLQGLSEALTSRVWVLFQQRTALKGRLASAKTLEDVQAVKWTAPTA